jgi:hypothetical protein
MGAVSAAHPSKDYAAARLPVGALERVRPGVEGCRGAGIPARDSLCCRARSPMVSSRERIETLTQRAPSSIPTAITAMPAARPEAEPACVMASARKASVTIMTNRSRIKRMGRRYRSVAPAGPAVLDPPLCRQRAEPPTRYGLVMQSWRDALSAPAQADVDRLLDSAIRLAQQSLAQASEFDPFALVAAVDGRLLAVDLDVSGLGKHPDSVAIMAATAAQLKTLASSARCTALAGNTRLSQEKTDAIEVRIEHREGVALLVLLPYKRPKFGGRIEYGEPRAFPGKREIWV